MEKDELIIPMEQWVRVFVQPSPEAKEGKPEDTSAVPEEDPVVDRLVLYIKVFIALFVLNILRFVSLPVFFVSVFVCLWYFIRAFRALKKKKAAPIDVLDEPENTHAVEPFFIKKHIKTFFKQRNTTPELRTSLRRWCKSPLGDEEHFDTKRICRTLEDLAKEGNQEALEIRVWLFLQDFSDIYHPSRMMSFLQDIQADGDSLRKFMPIVFRGIEEEPTYIHYREKLFLMFAWMGLDKPEEFARVGKFFQEEELPGSSVVRLLILLERSDPEHFSSLDHILQGEFLDMLFYYLTRTDGGDLDEYVWLDGEFHRPDNLSPKILLKQPLWKGAMCHCLESMFLGPSCAERQRALQVVGWHHKELLNFRPFVLNLLPKDWLKEPGRRESLELWCTTLEILGEWGNWSTDELPSLCQAVLCPFKRVSKIAQKWLTKLIEENPDLKETIAQQFYQDGRLLSQGMDSSFKSLRVLCGDVFAKLVHTQHDGFIEDTLGQLGKRGQKEMLRYMEQGVLDSTQKHTVFARQLRSSNPLVRKVALEGLRDLKEDLFILLPDLLRRSQEHEQRVQVVAMEVLTRWLSRCPEAVQPHLHALTKEDATSYERLAGVFELELPGELLYSFLLRSAFRLLKREEHHGRSVPKAFLHLFEKYTLLSDEASGSSLKESWENAVVQSKKEENPYSKSLCELLLSLGEEDFQKAVKDWLDRYPSYAEQLAIQRNKAPERFAEVQRRECSWMIGLVGELLYKQYFEKEKRELLEDWKGSFEELLFD